MYGIQGCVDECKLSLYSWYDFSAVKSFSYNDSFYNEINIYFIYFI